MISTIMASYTLAGMKYLILKNTQMKSNKKQWEKADLQKGGVFSQTKTSAKRGAKESKIDVFGGDGVSQYAAQNPDRRICRFLLGIMIQNVMFRSLV